MTGSRGGISVLRMLLATLRARREIMIVASAGIVLLAVLLLSRGRTWQTETRFMPGGGSADAAGVASIALRLGINVGVGEPTNSPQFFSDLVTSRDILKSVARDTFDLQSGSPARGSIEQLYHISGGNALERREYALMKLESDISSHVDLRSGVVVVTVKAKDPRLAQQLATALLRHLDQFNQQQRRSSARDEREFTGQRLAAVERELRADEDTLRDFVLANRSYQSSPALSLEYQRRSRKLDVIQQVYASLAQAFEQARIAEVRDTPVITVLEEPDVPALPLPRHTIQFAILVVLLSIPTGLVIAFARNPSHILPGGLSDVETWHAARVETRSILRWINNSRSNDALRQETPSR